MTLNTILIIVVAILMAPIVLSILSVMVTCAGLVLYGAWQFVAECLWELFHGSAEW